MRSLAILARWIWLPGAALSALAALLVVVATLDVEDTSALAANTGQLRVLAMSAANAALIGDRPGLDAAIQERRTRLESLHDPLQAVLGEEAATASLTLITAQFEVQERELLGGAIDSERLEQQTALIVTQVDGLLDALSETRDRRVDDIQRISVISTVLILAGGTVAAGAGVALQRRAQHAALAEQRIASQYESLITSMQNGLLLTDEHDRILYANRSLAEMLGVHPEQIIGQEASQLSPPAHREAATTRRRTVLLTGELDPPLLTHLLSERFGPLDVVATMTPIREGSRVAAVLSEYRNVTQETVLRAQ
ncbi:MAG: PAS domain-containing protein, partial [Dehalococcoidia bacterium]